MSQFNLIVDVKKTALFSKISKEKIPERLEALTILVYVTKFSDKIYINTSDGK